MIKIYTRSINPILYHRSMALCTLPYEKVRLTGTSADGYIQQVISDTSADVAINIDEDAFITDPKALERLIEYCIAEGYINCGMPDGGVVHLRDGNPLVTNPYFNILNTKVLRDVLPIELPLEIPDKNRFIDRGMLTCGHDFAATDIEPYYPIFIWMANHCKTLYLKATDHPDGESTILYNHLGEPFLIHTWYSRFYNRDPFHTHRIDRAFQEAAQQQGIKYYEPLADMIHGTTCRLKNTLLRKGANIKRRLFH